jgi:hypothetical protein
MAPWRMVNRRRPAPPPAAGSSRPGSPHPTGIHRQGAIGSLEGLLSEPMARIPKTDSILNIKAVTIH